MQVGGFRFQRGLLAVDGALQGEAAFPQAVVFLAGGFLALQFPAGGVKLLGAGGDGVGPFRQGVAFGEALGEGGDGAFRLLGILAQGGDAADGGGDGVLLAAQFGDDGALLFGVRGGGGDLVVQFGQPGGDARQFG